MRDAAPVLRRGGELQADHLRLAEEARPYDIRVTAILPGATDTPIWDERPGFDRAKMMKPEDVAGFLTAIVVRPGISVEEVTVTPPAGAL